MPKIKDFFLESAIATTLQKKSLNLSNRINVKRTKKAVKLTLNQIIYLLTQFNQNNKPKKEMILNIAKVSSMSQERIRTWFKNKRKS
jgi:hypothetical protein